MKKTNRFAVVLLVVAMLLSLGGMAFALEGYEVHTLEEYPISVSLPEDMLAVLTRDMEEGDPSLAVLGVTADDVNALLVSGGNYMDAISSDMDWEFILTVMDGEEVEELNIILKFAENSDWLADGVLDEYAEGVAEGLELAGVTLVGDVNCGLSQIGEQIYLECGFSMENGGVLSDAVTYMTVFDGVAYQLGFTTINCVMTGELQELFLNILENVTFGTPAAEAIAETETAEEAEEAPAVEDTVEEPLVAEDTVEEADISSGDDLATALESAGVDEETYEKAVRIGTIVGIAVVVLVPLVVIGLIVLVIVLIARNAKLKKKARAQASVPSAPEGSSQPDVARGYTCVGAYGEEIAPEEDGAVGQDEIISDSFDQDWDRF